jgi:ATP-dependent Clp protease protease subunit
MSNPTSVLIPTVIEQEGRIERAYDIYSRLVYDALAIYDTMQFVEPDIQTVGIGVQASAAAFLLSSGTKGKRSILEHATVMIHQPSSGTRGKVTDQEIDLRESLRIKHLLEEIMAKNTGQKVEKIHDDMERDKWLTAEEAKKYGIVDQIITKKPASLKK